MDSAHSSGSSRKSIACSCMIVSISLDGWVRAQKLVETAERERERERIIGRPVQAFPAMAATAGAKK